LKKTTFALASTTRRIVQPKPISPFDALADSAYIRESQLVRSPRRPACLPVLPFSASTLWRKVSLKTFPAPVKLSDKVSAWKVGDVRAWLRTMAGEAPAVAPEYTQPKPTALRNQHLKSRHLQSVAGRQSVAGA
jgi:prophage regulatory protein